MILLIVGMDGYAIVNFTLSSRSETSTHYAQEIAKDQFPNLKFG